MQNLRPLTSLTSVKVNQSWDLQAVINVLQADKNADGRLNAEEYNKVALVKGDGYLSTMARNYEFAVVDEVKLADGQVTISELSSFYQTMDSDKNGKHSQNEFESRLNQSSWLTRLRNPIASFTHIFSQYTGLLRSSLS